MKKHHQQWREIASQLEPSAELGEWTWKKRDPALRLQLQQAVQTQEGVIVSHGERQERYLNACSKARWGLSYHSTRREV